MNIRKELQDFANEMERVLKLNDFKSSWKENSVQYLNEKLLEELVEYLLINYKPIDIVHTLSQRIIEKEGERDEHLAEEELIDIANVCMMLHDKIKNDRPKRKCK